MLLGWPLLSSQQQATIRMMLWATLFFPSLILSSLLATASGGPKDPSSGFVMNMSSDPAAPINGFFFYNTATSAAALPCLPRTTSSEWACHMIDVEDMHYSAAGWASGLIITDCRKRYPCRHLPRSILYILLASFQFIIIDVNIFNLCQSSRNNHQFDNAGTIYYISKYLPRSSLIQ